MSQICLKLPVRVYRNRGVRTAGASLVAAVEVSVVLSVVGAVVASTLGSVGASAIFAYCSRSEELR